MTVPKKSYPDYEPAWVEDKANGQWILRWLKGGKPVEEIGVLREADVPGIHTPQATEAIVGQSIDKQFARQWPSAASEDAPVTRPVSE